MSDTKQHKSCTYCGWIIHDEKDHTNCKNSYFPLYLNKYQMGNLIAMFALCSRSPMDKGDFFGEILIKMQQWCRDNGIPIENNFGMKLDSTTWSEGWSEWLDNLKKSGYYRMKIESET